jgi:hypothetical protein
MVAVGVVLLTGAAADAQKGPRGHGSEFEAARNGWLFSLAQGKALAAKTNKPLMVVMRCVP